MKLIRKFVALGALTLAAAGCQTAGTKIGPIESLPNGSFILTRDYGAEADKTNKVLFLARMKPDCAFMTYVPVSIVQQPSHGTLTVRQTRDVPPKPPYDALKAACYSKPVAGMLVEYTPEPGYHGTDHFAYQFAEAKDSMSTTFIPGGFIRHDVNASVQ